MTIRILKARKGFTLIELLTVIAIIGILAGVLIAAVGPARAIAQKSTAANNARQLASSYQTFSNSGSTPRSISTAQQNSGGTRQSNTASTIDDVAFILAQKAEINDAKLWFIPTDEALAGKAIPASVIEGEMQTATDVAAGFKKTNPKAWAFVIGMSTSASGTTTPLLWTYGLGTDGLWVTDSPWKGKGGHIAFLDSHVQWYERLSTDPGAESLVIYAGNPNAGVQTVNYQQAIPSNARNPSQVVNAMGQTPGQ